MYCGGVFGGSVTGPRPGPVGPGLSNFPECNPDGKYSQEVENELNFIVQNFAAAASVTVAVDQDFHTNISVAVVLGWAGHESGWGVTGDGVSQGNNNYYSQTAPGSNWIGQAPCPSNANTGYVCFSDYQSSAESAFFSPINALTYQSAAGSVSGPSAAFIIADQLANGGSLTSAFTIIGTKWAPGQNYGGPIVNTINGAAAHIDCLEKYGYLTSF